MLAPTSYAVRPAASYDALALRRMAAAVDQRPLTGEVLVGELAGVKGPQERKKAAETAA